MPKGKKKRGFFAVLLRIVGILLLAVVILTAGLFGVLCVTEYKPADREALAVEGEASGTLKVGDTVTILTWNIGYGALGDNADFFMDGGKGVYTADLSRVLSNLASIRSWIGSLDWDLLLLQEIDRNSSRSYHIDEYDNYQFSLDGFGAVFANNFKTAFLPYPIPPIGKVDSGIASFSRYPISSAERIQLPIPFSWPVSMVNLKRCLLVTRIPVEGTDRELVLVNLHLEAYDDGEGKVEQTKMLVSLMEEEAAKGNYVIAGGDFNQIFSTEDKTPFIARPGVWAPGEIDVSVFGDSWQFLMDETVPTCRSLDQPYAGADQDSFQYYLIDGFIVSDNITVESVKTQDLGFFASDHNPVVLQVTLEDPEGSAAQDAPTEPELRARFPEYYDLSTFKGLEVYVWQEAEDTFLCGVMEGTNRNKTDEEIAALAENPATVEEMKMILSSYGIPYDNIFIAPCRQLYSDYYYTIDEAYQKKVNALFGK